jgi:hypothetical protein
MSFGNLPRASITLNLNENGQTTSPLNRYLAIRFHSIAR